MPFILALDQGTTSSRAILFNANGHIEAVSQREFPQFYPHPGWVEHDPMQIWQSQLAVAREVFAKKNLAPSDVAAIGITNQRETTVVWDRTTGQPIANAIVWQDRRTADVCQELRRLAAEPMIQARTGLVIDAYFSASKLRWLLDNVPGARQRAGRGELAFGTVDSWLLYNLTGGPKTGVHATDPSNASRTMLFNIHSQTWDPELLDLFQIPREVLPEIVPTSGLIHESSPGIFGRPIPIAAIAGDQQAALFGQTCLSPGLAKNTYGTGCFMLMNTGSAPAVSRNKLLATIAWNIAGHTRYALEGSVFIGGAVVQWLRDGLGLIKSAADVEPLAKSVPDNGGIYLVPAFAGLGAPHWDPHARGIITGITRGTTAGHFARAALESIAFQVADLLEIMRQDSGMPIKELRVDGGAAANDLLLQFQADLLRIPILRPKITETTALGAAYLAGLGAGFWKSPEEIVQHWAIDRTFEPTMPAENAAEMRRHWDRALERSRNWCQPNDPSGGPHP